MASLKKRLYLHCSAKRIVFGVGILLGVRLLWAALFPSQSRWGETSNGEIEPEEGFLYGIFGHRLHDSSDNGTVEKYSRGLEFGPSGLTLNGKPFKIISGSFHYFRTRPEQWPDRFARMKAAGLNTVTTYVAWNVHERQRGIYDFKADGYDLVSFVKMAHQVGFYVIVRPGPFICAEWEFGGFPSWLLHDPNMKLRTSKYKPYLTHVDRFFKNLLPLLKRLTFRNGGPIIAFQVENEYGSYSASPDQVYLRFLVGLFKRSGIKELLLTSDGSTQLPVGSLDELYPTVNFNDRVKENLDRLMAFRPGNPLMVTEFWPGWFDHWTEIHHVMATPVFVERVSIVLQYNASINFYMFVGGTNFGFWNGANNKSSYAPTVTSYDYDAPISECGDVHPTKFKAWRDMLVKFGLVVASDLPPIPADNKKVSYGTVKVQHMMALDVVCEIAAGEVLTLQDPIFMEFLDANDNGGQSLGWIIYRIQLSGKSARLHGVMHDRAQIFLNGEHYKTLYSIGADEIDEQISLFGPSTSFVMIVENMGRVNYGDAIVIQRKGFQGVIEVDGVKASSWDHLSLEFDKESIKSLQLSKRWKNVDAEQKMPTLYRSTFSVNQKPEDTFLDMSSWSKGIVIINGFNIGRYWNVGPQQTLYVPWPLLKKGVNDIIVFELEKPATELKFTRTHMLNTTIVRNA